MHERSPYDIHQNKTQSNFPIIKNKLQKKNYNALSQSTQRKNTEVLAPLRQRRALNKPLLLDNKSNLDL